MSTTTRLATADDLDGLWEVFRLGFGARESERAAWMAGVRPERAIVADGPRGEIAAASHIRHFDQWFGGRPVPMGGFSPVAVLPEFRGRGLGRAVTAGQFAAMREQGEVISGLFPASQALYRSVGFEIAGSYVLRRFPASEVGRIAPRRPVEVRRGRVPDVEALHRCQERLAAGRDGTLRRDAGWWERRLPTDLDGVVVYVVDQPDAPGEVAGYAIYRHGPGPRPYDYTVVVTEVLADDPDVLRALWRVVGSSGSQAPWVEVVGPADDDLFLLLDTTDPVAVRNEIRWMLRLVDAPGAVAARGWNPTVTGTVHLDIHDEHAPWNAGRWVLEVEGGSARLEPGGSGVVSTSIGGLSTWWAGHTAASRLARMGHLVSTDPQALATMDSLIPAVPPVLPDFY
jgi:predicted acetyltransferase